MEAPMKMWRKRGGGTVSMENINGSEDEEDGDEAKPEAGDAGVGVRGNEDRVGGVAMVIIDSHLRQIHLRRRSTLFCGGARSGN